MIHEKPQQTKEKSGQHQLSGAIALYGAGKVGRDALKVLRNSYLDVKFFLDQTACLDSGIDGIPVFPPNSSVLSLRERQETTVIITIFNPMVNIANVHGSLKDLGYKKIVTFWDFYQIYHNELGDRYWLAKAEFYQDYGDELQAVADLLDDEKSRDLFERILQFRFTGNYSSLPDPDFVGQYFPADLPKWQSPLRIVDCGACNGDTIQQIIGLGLKLEAVAAFEPDRNNFGKLIKALAQIDPEIPYCLTWPCGVGAGTTQFRFDGDQGTGSSISLTGSQVIQCVALDEALINFQPTLIKMDIEGSEYDALIGAQTTIGKNRPGLAICLYHRPQHLWEIPLLIRKITKTGGKYFLRCHAFSSFELVLYWIP